MISCHFKSINSIYVMRSNVRCKLELLTIIPWWKLIIKFPFCFRSVKFEVSEFQFELRNDREEQKNAEEDSRPLPENDHSDTTANSQDAPDDRKRKTTVCCSRDVPIQISRVVKLWGKICRFQILCADVSLFHGRQNSSFNDGKQSFEDGKQSFMIF